MVILFVFLITERLLGQETSTGRERARWVEITHILENSPLDASANEQGEWALKRLMEVHDVQVPLCPILLHEFNEMKYSYGHQVVRQFMLGTAAVEIENPEQDSKSMSIAAVESVLKMYQSILKINPNAKSKNLSELEKKQNEGKLRKYLREKCP